MCSRFGKAKGSEHMAYSFNGFGTTFYGERDYRPDGTHITTEWIIFFGIPIIPLRSLHVRYQGKGKRKIPIGFGSAHNYLVHESGRPHWKQVFNTYAFSVFVLAWIGVMAWLFFGEFEFVQRYDYIGAFGLIAACSPPFLLLRLLSCRERRKAGFK
jgi:hypothetical protein